METTSFRLTGNDCGAMCISYRKVENERVESGFYNVFLAALTTTHARLKLFGVLNGLGDRAFHCDTDSILFPEPEMGFCLGQMSNDLSHPDEYVVRYFALAPKSYRLQSKRESDPNYENVKIRMKGKTSATTSPGENKIQSCFRFWSHRPSEKCPGRGCFRRDSNREFVQCDSVGSGQVLASRL